MAHEYKVRRKVYAQGGSFLIALPRLWADANGIDGQSTVVVRFNGEVRVEPDDKPEPKAK